MALLGLGITFSPHAYFGGLFLALAGAAISRAWEKEVARKAGNEVDRESTYQFMLVVLTAFFVSTLIAIAVHTYFPSWSLQGVMAASGFASRKIVIMSLSVIHNIASKGDIVADKILDHVLPDTDKKDEK